MCACATHSAPRGSSGAVRERDSVSLGTGSDKETGHGTYSSGAPLAGDVGLGTQFTCFTGTKVQALTQKALLAVMGDAGSATLGGGTGMGLGLVAAYDRRKSKLDQAPPDERYIYIYIYIQMYIQMYTSVYLLYERHIYIYISLLALLVQKFKH